MSAATSPEFHFSIDADLAQTIEEGPERAECPCPTCGAKFRPTSFADCFKGTRARVERERTDGGGR